MSMALWWDLTNIKDYLQKLLPLVRPGGSIPAHSILRPQPKGRHPLPQDGLRMGGAFTDGGQGGGTDQHSSVITPVIGAGGILGRKGS